MSAKILLVEDNADCRDLVGAVLEGNFEVDYVDNGEALLGAAMLEIDVKKERPDIVLLNYQLPNAAGKPPIPIGLKLLRIIKREWPETKVIMFTGCYTVDIAFQAAKLGAFDFVQKPCSNEKLLEVLKNATEKNLIHNKSNQPHQNVTDSGTLTQMECAERDAITQTLVATNGNKLETAKRLGIGRQTLYNKIKAFEIET